jgi:hypothetical protein
MPHAGSALHHAVRIIHAVCGLAGSARLTDEVRIELRADNVRAAIRRRDTGPVFDWLMAALSYQGISDQVAYEYMAQHGRARWHDIDGAAHPYGLACYRPGGCAEIIQAVAEGIDARQFNPSYPQTFPRFVQHAIWQYCSASGLDVCNGNRIDDTTRCGNLDCAVRLMCDRVRLKAGTPA